MEFEKYDGFKLYKDVDLVDLPCYSCPPVQADFRKKIRKMSFVIELSNEDMNIMKILVKESSNLSSNLEILNFVEMIIEIRNKIHRKIKS